MSLHLMVAVCFGQSYGERMWTPPAIGTFYSIPMGGTNSPPYPFLPVDPIEVPVYSLGITNAFLFDGLESSSSTPEGVPPPPGEGGEDPGVPASVAYDYGTNDLWLEIFPLTNTIVPLLLHGVRSNYYYRLDETNLLAAQPKWRSRQIVQNTSGTNPIAFLNVPTDGLPSKFFRAAEGYPLLRMLPGGEAIEGQSTNNNDRSVGYFQIQFADVNQTLSTNLLIHYAISGYKISASAENGVDYTNLPGSVIMPANNYAVLIDIDPYPDGFIEFCEFVTLTLIQTNGYLVDPTNASATITISDHFMPDIFTVVVENLPFAGGIGYHPLSNSLVASLKGNNDEFNFVQIYTNIMFTNSVYVTNTVITNWSGVTNLGQEEIKLTIVQTTTNGFNQGEMFFGPGGNGIVGKTSPDGTFTNLNWAILSTNQATFESIIRGGLHVDETGIFGNNLLVVTGNGGDQGGGVWEIASNTNATQLANITNDARPHLEGVLTLTNSLQLWGPWAGKVITGAESKTPPLVHTVDTNDLVSSFEMGIEPEDFDIVKPNWDLYCVHEGSVNAGVPHRIIKLSRSLLTNYWGALVITQEGAQHTPAKNPALFIVQWNPTNSIFFTRCIPYQFYFEHVTFAPIKLPDISQP